MKFGKYLIWFFILIFFPIFPILKFCKYSGAGFISSIYRTTGDSPWWCNAAVSRCKTGYKDPCCIDGWWPNDSTACTACRVYCPGRNC